MEWTPDTEERKKEVALEEARMLGIADKVCRMYGFKCSNVQMHKYRDMDVKWVRKFPVIEFNICDYIEGAPDDVIESMFHTLMRGIIGPYDDGRPGRRFGEYIYSEEFLDRRPMWMARHGITVTRRDEDGWVIAYSRDGEEHISYTLKAILLPEDLTAAQEEEYIAEAKKVRENIVRECLS